MGAQVCPWLFLCFELLCLRTMLLGRIARSVALPALRRPPAASFPKTPVFGSIPMRNASSMPSTLSVRWDGLFIQCCVAAIIYFVPQDAVFLAGVLWVTHSTASAISPKTKTADVDAAVEQFKAKKGLESVKVIKGRSGGFVSL